MLPVTVLGIILCCVVGSKGKSSISELVWAFPEMCENRYHYSRCEAKVGLSRGVVALEALSQTPSQQPGEKDVVYVQSRQSFHGAGFLTVMMKHSIGCA